jgi:hypothetical protein
MADRLDFLERAYLPPGSDEPVPCDRATFEQWSKKKPRWYLKKEDSIGVFRVTTRFAGVDTQFSVPPLWWRVSIHQGFKSHSERAFATLKEALKRHSELVDSLRIGTVEQV